MAQSRLVGLTEVLFCVQSDICSQYVLQHARSSHGAVRSSMFSALGALLLCSPVNASRAVEAGLLSLVFSLLDDSEEDPPARRDAAFCLHLVSGYCYESHKSIVDAGENFV